MTWHVLKQLFNLIWSVPVAMASLPILAIDCGTELGPAISFAYEPAESDVMHRPPRNAKHDRLVTLQMTLYILIAGCMETAVGIIAFYLYFQSQYGIGSDQLNALGAGGAFATGSDAIGPYKDGLMLDDSRQLQALLESQTLYWVVVRSVLCALSTRV